VHRARPRRSCQAGRLPGFDRPGAARWSRVRPSAVRVRPRPSATGSTVPTGRGDRRPRGTALGRTGDRASGQHLAVVRDLLDRLDPGPDVDRLDLCPGPPLPGRAIEGRADDPRERGPRPAPARLGRRRGLRRRRTGDLYLLQPVGPPAPGLRVGRSDPRPEHARPDPPLPFRWRPIRRHDLPDRPDLPDRRGDPWRGGYLLEGRRLDDPRRISSPPDPSRRRDAGRRGDFRRRPPRGDGPRPR